MVDRNIVVEEKADIDRTACDIGCTEVDIIFKFENVIVLSITSPIFEISFV